MEDCQLHLSPYGVSCEGFIFAVCMLLIVIMLSKKKGGEEKVLDVFPNHAIRRNK